MGTPAVAPSTPSTDAVPTSIPAPSAIAAEDTPLRVWLPSRLAPSGDNASALELSVDTFADANDERVELTIKPSYGPAGIHAFLMSSAEVAPDRLPDLAAIPLEAVASAREAGVIQAFGAEDLVARARESFPFAARAVEVEDQVWALPLALDVLIVIGREVQPPRTWETLLSQGPTPFAFPIGGADPPNLAASLSIYREFGGRLDDLSDVDLTALNASLELIERGLAQGAFVPPEGGGSPRSAWGHFAAAEPAGAVVGAGAAINHQGGYPGMTWAALPGPSAPASPLGWGWALVMMSQDPSRAARAESLARWLTDVQRGPAVLSSGSLPANRAFWSAAEPDAVQPRPSDDFLAFVASQLAIAEGLGDPLPHAMAWGGMLDDLLAGSPAETAALRVLEPTP